jgi:hypothetical protein
LLSALLACASASADTLNFEPLGPAELTPAELELDGTVIQGSGTSLYIFASDMDLGLLTGDGGAVCSAFRPDLDTLSCAADMQISFRTAVSNLSLQTFGHDDGDSVTISAYAGNTMLGTPQIVTSNTVVDFSALSGVTKLVFDDQSAGANGGSGYAFGKFSFTPLTSPVPEPATGVLTLLGAAALGWFVRRRQAA